jgi:hypothetical protein
MGRKPSNFITISNGEIILFGGGVMERANNPKYLYAEWHGDRVLLHREEDYEAKRQGIYKVGWSGSKNGRAQARITARQVVEDAGLANGRYTPISVDEDTIIFPTTPVQTPENYSRQKDTEDEV